MSREDRAFRIFDTHRTINARLTVKAAHNLANKIFKMLG